MVNKIEEIASVHLGKAGDGSLVKPYVTPDKIDPSLLVAIPRHLNRADYGITDADFTGFDMWNCYEVSALMSNGFPVSGVVKLSYASNSDSIVESKSLKLYLNSFNMATMGKTVDEVRLNVVEKIAYDLTFLLGVIVDVGFHLQNAPTINSLPLMAVSIEDTVDLSSIKFDAMHESESLLKVVNRDHNSEHFWTTSALRSNCRVTNQPDWGDLYVYIHGDKTVTPESLLQYVVSMRRENHFHEEIVECVAKRLITLLPGCSVGVAALYTRRGGIDINPVRANSSAALFVFSHLGKVHIKHRKTDRQ